MEQSSFAEQPVVSAPEHSRRGYETTKYSKEKKLCSIMVQEVNLKTIRRQLKQLMEVFNVVGTLLVLPTRESINLLISKQWRKIQCKSVLDKGSFLIHLFVEIYEFFNTYGNPTRNRAELTWQLFQIFPAGNGILEGIMDDGILDRSDLEIEGIIREIISVGAWGQLDVAVEMLITNMALSASSGYQLNHHHPDLGLRNGVCRPTMMETYDFVENTPWTDRLSAL